MRLSWPSGMRKRDFETQWHALKRRISVQGLSRKRHRYADKLGSALFAYLWNTFFWLFNTPTFIAKVEN